MVPYIIENTGGGQIVLKFEFIEEGRGWAFTRRHDDGVSSIWLAEYRSHLQYTLTLYTGAIGNPHIRRERKRELPIAAKELHYVRYTRTSS